MKHILKNKLKLIGSFNFVAICTLKDSPKLGELINYVACILVKSVVPLIFALAVVVFVWGVVIYVINNSEEAKKAKGKMFMIWGIIGLTVMISVWGLVAVLGNTFGITSILPQLPTGGSSTGGGSLFNNSTTTFTPGGGSGGNAGETGNPTPWGDSGGGYGGLGGETGNPTPWGDSGGGTGGNYGIGDGDLPTTTPIQGDTNVSTDPSLNTGTMVFPQE